MSRENTLSTTLRLKRGLLGLAAWLSICSAYVDAQETARDEPRSVSGIYPSLAFFNEENECGTGAVVPWADRLWVVTYAPHRPTGSTDKLYEITPDLQQIIRPESIGGTPANRMIHRESKQLFIGPYAIDANRNVRVIPYTRMFGRPTGNARHLSDPANKIYCASMEEGFYEIDVHTLEVATLYHDEQVDKQPKANLSGYHGKGFYSGQGRVIYANNGEHGSAALRNPFVPSGVLAEWDGANWHEVLRSQFTEVTGPGGIHGNARADSDPIWSVGWDARSLILMLLDDGKWYRFRLPKASHSYDGAHGWNTEWPRIRDIGEDDLLMTMHGMFWKFPKTFSARNRTGIEPRSTYLKVIGDFCRWHDRIVLGCDDTAMAEFLNKRKAKGEIAAPQSQSNLWFLPPERLDQLGPVIGRGGVWLEEDVEADTPSDPFLISGFGRRGLHLSHEGTQDATFVIEADAQGDGNWSKSREVEVGAGGSKWVEVAEDAVWLRVRSAQPLTKATAWFGFSNRDTRATKADGIFAGVAALDQKPMTGGLIRARGGNKRTLSFAAISPGASGNQDLGYYELDGDLNLRRTDDATVHRFTKENTRIPVGVIAQDDASVVFTDDEGKRWRLPKGKVKYEGPLGPHRVAREVATERDLFNAFGTFYELPANNAGGFAKIRPVATHNRRIHDFCSYRGLFVLSGVSADAPADNAHIIRSDDGKTALWVGAIDDIWKFGKPVGQGGPWKQTAVKADVPSDPYLMTAYDQKTVVLAHDSRQTVTVMLEVDLTGEGQWVPYREFDVPPSEILTHKFPDAFSAYWLRALATRDCTATVQLTYE